ncbi:serine/threonine protein kinase [Microbispora sp. SCL1-1]|uniref:Serine/threonine protein kinase n=1 Tax=Microbispora hainanensis TaxID=568844 RepID=A0ABZ1T3Y4_9ACTN|nr:MULTISPECIES: serine/threonine-protein kinase [Microbispora]NJP23754.1 serine/threonine protein kinase [Microbispora sp. CL1-1]TQS15958.1 serine/threonine protein kinase [Microbispora sp. SCL1-1]
MAGRLGRVGPYALLERLGRGGMGEVYLAVGRRGDRVALKMLRDPIENDPDARLRLEREVRALRRVESPYVAQVLDADLSGDRPYLVMDYIEGENLLDAVRRHGPLPESRLITLAQGLASALAIIHAGGIVHRDVKPANVLLGEDGPVLIDFGIAQVLDATRVTMTGTFLGTPGYCAPEVFAEETVGAPADVHGWAATVAFAATGRPTFGRGTAESQMYAVLNGKADLVGVPAALLPLVRAALHRDPARRPTAALLADRLSRLARVAGESSRAPGEPSAAETTTRTAMEAARARAASDAKPGAKTGTKPDAKAGVRKAAKPEDKPVRKGAETTAREPATAAERAARRGGPAARPRRVKAATALATAPEGAPEGALGIPTGNAALVLVALLAVPCVVVSVVYPLATFAITAALAVVIRAVWTSHWLVRRRKPGRARACLRALAFPLTLAGSVLSAVAWPGLPAAAVAFAGLWAISGGRLEPEWWSRPVPVTIAGIAFGVVSGAIIGREIERAGAAIPGLRREGLRALAVLGGFVALCAAAVRAVAFFF